jgi:poly-gamma-glutamate synthesis protein (capsule biosynthesis protein)
MKTSVKKQKKDIVIAAFTGDIMMGRRMEPLLTKYGTDYPFTLAAKEFDGCDIVFGNSEAPIVYPDKIKDMQQTPGKEIYLYMQEGCAQAMKNAGYNILSLANNHALDYREDALLQTMDILDRYGIKYAGVGKDNSGRPDEPLIMEINGVKVGFLCYSQVSPASFYPTRQKYGVIPAYISLMKKDIKAARPKVDTLIVYIHWGKEGQAVLKYQYAQAREMIDEGADLIIGSHTHLFQDIELYNGKYIFYGLGNFVFDQEKESNKYSAIVKARIEKGKISGVKVIPVYLNNYRPEIITDGKKLKEFWSGINLINLDAADISDNKQSKI